VPVSVSDEYQERLWRAYDGTPALIEGHDPDATLTGADIREMFFAISEAYRPGIEHWTIGPHATEVLRELGHLPPEPVKAKTFDEWLAETSALLEECAERKK
jgi:hypothetical protein